MRKIALCLSILFVLVSSAMADDSMTVTHSRVTSSLSVLTCVCTANSAGAFSETADRAISGYLVCVQSDPGDVTPTDNYDVVINNADGVDLMGGNMADRDSTSTELARPTVSSSAGGVPVNGQVTIEWDNNSVDSAEVTYKLYYYEF